MGDALFTVDANMGSNVNRVLIETNNQMKITNTRNKMYFKSTLLIKPSYKNSLVQISN